jgi:hypothetical protein
LNKKIWLLLITFTLLIATFTTLPVKAVNTTYTFTGPYYDDGTVPNNGQTSVTLYYANSSAYTFSLQATGTTPATVQIVSTVPVEQAIWNASTNIINQTRIFTFLGTAEDTNTTYIRIMNPEQAYYQYTFSVADFFGMLNPYIETNVGPATNTPVERQSLNTTGIATFFMQQYVPYRIIFRCDQGILVQSFTPGSTFNVNLQVLAGSFPSTVTNDSFTTATRTNSTTLTITYLDQDAVTQWLYIQITHQDGAYLVVDSPSPYNYSSTNSISIVATVDNETEYFVQVQAYRYGGIIKWNFACPVLTLTNPFTGLLDFLGTWPTGFDPAQIFAAAIIMCALGLGSFRSAGVSCILAWILAGFFTAIGWFTIGIPMLAFSGVISIIVVLTEGKEVARDA